MDVELKLLVTSLLDTSQDAKAPPPAATKAMLLKLSKHMTIEQVFQAIAVNCMAQIQANEAGVVQEYDAESLHQMRVGLRRLRSAAGLFKGVLQLPEDLQQELDWLTTQLSAARDWDVLAGSTLIVSAEAIPDKAWLAAVKLAALGKAHEKHKAASVAVSSRRYTRLILQLTHWVQDCGWRDTMSPRDQNCLTAQAAKFTHNMLMHNQRRLLKRGRNLRGASPKARHQVRIAAKEMRYAAEFFQSLYSSKRVRPYVEALSTLQEKLGWLNDTVVAERLLKELQDEQTRLEGRVNFILGYLASRAKHDDKKTRKLWKKFASMKLRC